MAQAAPEALTCPSCKAVIRTEKTIGLSDDKRATCPRCQKPFMLGQARVKLAVALEEPPPVRRSRPEPPLVADVVPDDRMIVATRTLPTQARPPSQPPTLNKPAGNSLDRFVADGQNPTVVTKLLARLQEICTSKEEILYMAMQQRPIANFAPDAVVLTNRRCIIFRQKVLGRMDFVDGSWMYVVDVNVKE